MCIHAIREVLHGYNKVTYPAHELTEKQFLRAIRGAREGCKVSAAQIASTKGRARKKLGFAIDTPEQRHLEELSKVQSRRAFSIARAQSKRQ
jgi:hypothetical protein